VDLAAPPAAPPAASAAASPAASSAAPPAAVAGPVGGSPGGPVGPPSGSVCRTAAGGGKAFRDVAPSPTDVRGVGDALGGGTEPEEGWPAAAAAERV